MKILLNQEIKDDLLTEKKRNQLLSRMTQQVADLVLKDNYYQALALSYSVDHSYKLASLYQVYLKHLDDTGVVNRVVEFLPDDKQLIDRKAAGGGLTSPELAILLAYTKIHVKAEILNSDVPEDPYLSAVLETAFPPMLCKLYAKKLNAHPLRREIIATQLSNRLVNEMGITFVYRIEVETGGKVCDIIRAQMVSSRVFNTPALQKLIDSLGFKIPAVMQFELLHHVRTLNNLATRWFLRGNRLKGDLSLLIKHYSDRIHLLESVVPDLMTGVTKTYLEDVVKHFVQSGVSKEVGRRIAVSRAMYTSLNVIEVATQHHYDLVHTAKVYFEVGARFNLLWFRDQIAADNREGHWNTLARLTLRDELDVLQKLLTYVIMKDAKKEKDIDIIITRWMKKNPPALERWTNILNLLYSSPSVEYTMFFIAIREFSNWVTATAELEK